jgi:23S rRNA pseudouridine955/2504/2580 synthase
MLRYQLTLADHGRRMDSFLRNLLPVASPSYLHQLLKGGAVTLNGRSALPETILRQSDVVSVKETSRILQLVAGQRSAVEILFEDDAVVIFNKPAGLAVHRSAEHGGNNLVARGESSLSLRGMAVKLYAVNRLDKDTSGCVMMARSSAKAGLFGRLFQEGMVHKRYLALVEGRMAESGSIDLPLDGKESLSEYRTLLCGKGVSLLVVTPVTGRSHQIRRHLAAAGHAVLGDRRYGGRPLQGMTGHFLHSFRLEFGHPVTGSVIRVFAPLPGPFADALARFTDANIVTLLDSLLAD